MSLPCAPVTASPQLGPLSEVPGVPETALDPELLGRLPQTAPPAPWDLALQALVWFCPPGRAAAPVLPIARRASAHVVARGGGLVRYLETPVGGHAEALGAEVLWRPHEAGVHIPFMAADSPVSIVGGRRNWSVPKTLASFDGDPVGDRAMTARGDAWEISARARALGPPLPYATAFTLLQVWPDERVRRATAGTRGRARPARVTVEASGGADLRCCVGEGTFLGAIIESARVTLDAPR